jgi:hypothetical protein
MQAPSLRASECTLAMLGNSLLTAKHEFSFFQRHRREHGTRDAAIWRRRESDRKSPSSICR